MGNNNVGGLNVAVINPNVREEDFAYSAIGYYDFSAFHKGSDDGNVVRCDFCILYNDYGGVGAVYAVKYNDDVQNMKSESLAAMLVSAVIRLLNVVIDDAEALSMVESYKYIAREAQNNIYFRQAASAAYN